MLIHQAVRRGMMSSVPNPPVRSCGFIVYRNRDGLVEYLQIQSSRGRNNWMPPKGHVEEGETLYEAAARETLEEAGLREEDLDVDKEFSMEISYRTTSRRDGFNRMKIVTFWPARLKDHSTPVTLSHEHQDLRWLPLEEACKLSGFDNMQKAFRQCHERLKEREREEK